MPTYLVDLEPKPKPNSNRNCWIGQKFNWHLALFNDDGQSYCGQSISFKLVFSQMLVQYFRFPILSTLKPFINRTIWNWQYHKKRISFLPADTGFDKYLNQNLPRPPLLTHFTIKTNETFISAKWFYLICVNENKQTCWNTCRIKIK